MVYFLSSFTSRLETTGIRISNDFLTTANKLLLAAPKHSQKNQRPGQTPAGNEVNEHRYWQAA